MKADGKSTRPYSTGLSVVFTVYVSARHPHGGLGASRALFMCVDEIELRLPRPAPAGPEGWKVQMYVHPSCCHTQTRPRDLFQCCWVSYGLLTWLTVSRLPAAQRFKKHINRLNWSVRKARTGADPGGAASRLARTLSAEQGGSWEHARGFEGLFCCNGMRPSHHLSAQLVQMETGISFTHQPSHMIFFGMMLPL